MEGNTNDAGGPLFENNNHLRGPLLKIIIIWGVHYLEGNTNDLGCPLFENNNHLGGSITWKEILMIWRIHYLKLIII